MKRLLITEFVYALPRGTGATTALQTAAEMHEAILVCGNAPDADRLGHPLHGPRPRRDEFEADTVSVHSPESLRGERRRVFVDNFAIEQMERDAVRVVEELERALLHQKEFAQCLGRALAHAEEELEKVKALLPTDAERRVLEAANRAVGPVILPTASSDLYAAVRELRRERGTLVETYDQDVESES